MQFFLTEIVARVVAIYLFVEGARALWRGLAERKTSSVSYAFMDAFFPIWEWRADRDTAPFRYWFMISGQVFTLFVCLFMAIFGWWVPNK
jgi:hypothetical protein